MLKDRLQRVESQRLELEEEVSRQKSNMAADRIQMDEQVASAKQRVRNEEVHSTESIFSVVVLSILLIYPSISKFAIIHFIIAILIIKLIFFFKSIVARHLLRACFCLLFD